MNSSVQEVFNTTNAMEFRELVEACGYKVFTEDHLSIVQCTTSSNITIIPPVKGLIYNTVSGQIMAPGVHIPRAVQPSNKEAICIGYSRPIDGVMVRAWWNGDYWHWSTNGMITPKKLGEADFQNLLGDAHKPTEESFRLLKLDPKHRELCYFFVLENVENPLLAMPMEDTLTLVRTLDKAGNVVSDYDSLFSPRTEITHCSLEVCNIAFDDLNAPVEMESIDSFAIGLIYHYDDGTTFRRLTDSASAAQKLRLNFPTVYLHWVYHVKAMDDLSMLRAEVEANPLFRYKLFFPWHAHTIDGLSAFFLKEISDKNYTGTHKNVKALKEITDKYVFIIDTIDNPANWTYTPQEKGMPVLVSVPYIGDFPDSKSAHMTVDRYIQYPASTLFRNCNIVVIH